MSESEMTESTAGEMPHSTGPGESEEEGPSVTEGDVPTTAGEDSELESENATDVTTEGDEGLPGESPPTISDITEGPVTPQFEGPVPPQFEGRDEFDDRSEMSELVSELGEGGFSEFEQSESEFYEAEKEEEPVSDIPAYSSDVIQILSKQVDQLDAPVPTVSTVEAISTVKEKTPEKEVKRTYSFDESDEELSKIPVPAMKANKIIPKLPEPKYQPWPVKVFESENMYKVMEKAVPRFFPRNYPYSSKGVAKRCSLLAQYLQRKVFQMGHDRRKLITVVRFHQKNWNGHKAVIRWLWCMETDALVKYAHEGEGFVVSAVVIGLYMD